MPDSGRIDSVRPKEGGIYIASKAKHGPRWVKLRAEGAPINSTWIDESGQGETVDWRDLWRRCVSEAAGADALILYAEPGDVLKGALVEMGAALASKVPVFYVGPRDLLSALKHGLVLDLGGDFDAALAAACAAARVGARRRSAARKAFEVR